MDENTAISIIPILKRYPIRLDGSINLTPEALRRLGWPAGTMCQITLDLRIKGHERLIIEKGTEVS